MSSPYHYKTDRQSEIGNKPILGILRPKLLEQGQSWMKKIPHLI